MKRWIMMVGVALSLGGCSFGTPGPAEQPQPQSEVPITSKSPEAIDHFTRGRDLADNIRFAEAVREFDEAITLDPDFALALVYRGSATFGPEGLKDMEEAAAKAASASPAEQLMIAAMLSGRRGDFGKSEEQWRQLTEAVPGDWRAHGYRGAQLYGAQKYAEAIDSLTRATERNPNAGPAYNMIGYAHLVRGEAGPAVDALKKYASLAPSEPNPQDSLGEALMANGQFAESEAAFRKAIDLSPQFGVAWEGVAYTKFFAGDWEGGQAAVARARDAATRPAERMSAGFLGAVALLAENKTADGMKRLDELVKLPDASALDIAFAPAIRAVALAGNARYREAVAEAGTALQSTGQLPPDGPASYVRRLAFGLTVAAQARTGDAGAAEQTAAALRKEAATRPDDPYLASTVHFAEGAVAAARKDMKTARAQFDMCSLQDVLCHWQSLEISRQGGDTTGAEASLARLTKSYVRDPLYLYARSMATRSTAQRTN